MKRILAFMLVIVLVLALLSSCATGRLSHKKVLYEYFNTRSQVNSYALESKSAFDKNADLVESMLARYHKLYDKYYEYSGLNNIKTINDNAGVNPVEVDDEIIDLIDYSKEMYNLTRGKVNIAMGAVLELWHKARETANGGEGALPQREALLAASKHTNIDDVEVDRAARTVYLRDPEMSLDVGAIAKGYATERIAEALIERGVSGYALDIGRNIRLVGARSGGDATWTVGITHPNSSGDIIKTVAISDTSLVTSGDYERYFISGGERYHHIIDKDTLYPATYFTSVSVITPDSALADALTTALFCMPLEDGLDLISSLDNVEAMWVTADYTVYESRGFASLYK